MTAPGGQLLKYPDYSQSPSMSGYRLSAPVMYPVFCSRSVFHHAALQAAVKRMHTVICVPCIGCDTTSVPPSIRVHSFMLRMPIPFDATLREKLEADAIIGEA
jgi:hypothetical protein